MGFTGWQCVVLTGYSIEEAAQHDGQCDYEDTVPQVAPCACHCFSGPLADELAGPAMLEGREALTDGTVRSRVHARLTCVVDSLGWV